jgi:branched-chain amino acid aminotransferase
MTNLPYDDRDGFIWFDGTIKPWRECNIHVLTHSLHYGGSVFEGERVYEGEVFKLQEHSERLIKSAELIDMKIPYSVEDIKQATFETIKANNIIDGYVRPIAWRGSEQMAVSAQNTTVHLAIACWDWPKYFFPKNGEDSGIALKSSKWVRPDPKSMPVQSKSGANYVVGTMAKQEAERAGYDDTLMLDYRGYVAESSGSNLFFVVEGKLYTPIADCFLNGITRQTVIELAQAEEVFVTGTAAEITAVGKIDEKSYEVGPITKKLQQAYAKLVRQPAAIKATA